MKTTILMMMLVFASISSLRAFDVEKASTKRFKVSYVEFKKIPSLTMIPKEFYGREQALKDEQGAVNAGVSSEEVDQIRRIHLRDMYFPIRVTDTETGITYEVQSDRRTIVAKKKDGTMIWKVNPFEDANLKPYRVKHPFITYFGRSTIATQAGRGDRFLGVAFNSSQFGEINLANGSFVFSGQD